MIKHTSKFCGDVGAIVVKLSRLVIALARVVYRAAFMCDDEQNKAVLTVSQLVDCAAPLVHAYPAIDFAYPLDAPAFALHRV